MYKSNKKKTKNKLTNCFQKHALRKDNYRRKVIYFNFHKTEFSENSDYMVEMKGRGAISLNVQLEKTTNLFIGSTYIVNKSLQYFNK